MKSSRRSYALMWHTLAISTATVSNLSYLIIQGHILVWKTRKRTAVLRHSMGSSLAVDILLGNLIGLALLYNVKSTCSWIKDYGSDVSNWLRTGCVWLMGVPAGFKLNTKVAAVLGTISLNVTQTLDTHLPTMIPWMDIPVKEYSQLCLISVCFPACQAPTGTHQRLLGSPDLNILAWPVHHI
ncbi:hypothetical protein SAY87_029312 [Trapa incisa]|uniref:Uncharacterized protein n=1 Tax=Trapa incisa TaxID=236973 RepID=A0AAN7K492_9MYRT|nr:hypothetical protein SAY87_029312 [Trapa incisa]